MDIKQADSLLARWGDWSRDNRHNGFSSICILYRTEKEGGGAAHSQEYQGIVMPDDIAKAEACILMMDNKTRFAVKLKYIGREIDLKACNRCRCGITTYRQLIERAKCFVAWSMISE